ncbi:VWA-like domain-containing protein [uncultured Clostridium sp.]|uniref:vWA domain-containing protein n=1 Tax=uncultured Clostridium sp. TaxID=59620 RepID=UPI0028F0F555|nr:VWA-like domain-containing protein [uncultured Clostridium sp.]
MKESKFDLLRKELLKEVYLWEGEANPSPKFINDFNKLLELCTFSLMRGEDNFFALFIIQMKRRLDFSIASPLGTTASLSHFILHINPVIFLECTLEEMKALIKHEVYHIMFGHIVRGKELRKKYNDFVVNAALDISINQYIKNLPSWSYTIEMINWSFKASLEYEKNAEYYAEELNKAMDKLSGDKGPEILEKKDERDKSEMQYSKEHDIWKTHDIWTENKDDYNFEEIKELTRKTANNANKGKIPNAIEKALKNLNEKPEISWSAYLKKIMGALPVGYKKTITRKNRRQPDRLDLRGRLSNHVIQILVAIDISGSVTDEEIKKIMIEIFSIVKNHPCEITVIECDDRIRRIYKVKDLRDIKEKVDTRGGTSYSPVFQYIYDKKLRNHLLIYFTDGLGEMELKVKPINFKTLWVLTGKEDNLSLINPYGEIKKLSNKKTMQNDVTIALDEMKEIIKDWACAANQYI